MSLGGPKDFTQVFSIGRVVGNGTEDSPTGIQDPTQSGNMQIAFPEHGQGVDPQHIALSTSVGTKHGQNMRPFDNGQLVLALKTTGRNDCIILGPMTDILHDKEGMPGNLSGWSWFPPGETAINWPSKIISEVKGYVDARGLKTQQNDEGKVYKHSNRRNKITNGEYAETAGRKLPSIGQIPTALAQFAGILNPSSFGSLPGSNLNLGKSLKNLSDENKKKIQDSIPPEIWAILLALIDDLKEEQDTISYLSDRRVNEEVFIENAVALLSQVTSVADIMAAFNRLISDESLYGLDKLDNIVIEIETAFGNIQQIITATGNVTENVSNTVATSKNSMLNSMTSAASFPAGVGDNIFGKDSSQIFDMINRVAPQAQAALREAANRAGMSPTRKTNSQHADNNRDSKQPLSSVLWTSSNFAGA
jgi:hypothetical protein